MIQPPRKASKQSEPKFLDQVIKEQADQSSHFYLIILATTHYQTPAEFKFGRRRNHLRSAEYGRLLAPDGYQIIH